MELTRVCSTTPPPVTKKAIKFLVYKGTTFVATFTFKQPGNSALPVNITGMAVSFHAVDKDSAPILDLTTTSTTPNGSTINILDAVNGKVEVVITDEETALLSVGELSWWVTLDPPSGQKLLRARGRMTIINPY